MLESRRELISMVFPARREKKSPVFTLSGRPKLPSGLTWASRADLDSIRFPRLLEWHVARAFHPS
jgi:hypothetical protein